MRILQCMDEAAIPAEQHLSRACHKIAGFDLRGDWVEIRLI
ncbi:hypothetical protein [Mesorhizobium sp. M0199]